MMEILEVIDTVIYILLFLSVLYLFIFAFFSQFKHDYDLKDAKIKKNIAILLPAYKEDNVVLNSVKSFLSQTYPTENYDLVVIADRSQF